MRLKSWKLTSLTAASVLTASLFTPISGIAVPKIGAVSKVEKLADKIDKMQKHIDEYGTIVPKAADVWGQSRLMQHRIDVEKELEKKLDQFKFTLNATEITRDAAFLASAFALQGAANSGNLITPKDNTTNVFSVTNGLIGNPIGATDTTNTNNVPRSDFPTGFSNQFVSADAEHAGEVNHLSIEPTIELDQLKRYLDHLNQLRRNNEGDDTADSPGYSLNLVRIPISVLPGKKTRQGYGAEVSVTIKSYLSEELLPMAFKDLVINGLADRLAPTVMGIADRAPIFAVRKAIRRYYETIAQGTAPTTSPDNLDRFEQALADVVNEDLVGANSSEALRVLYNDYIDVNNYISEYEKIRPQVEPITAHLAELEKELECIQDEVERTRQNARNAYRRLNPSEGDIALDDRLESATTLYQQTKELPTAAADAEAIRQAIQSLQETIPSYAERKSRLNTESQTWATEKEKLDKLRLELTDQLSKLQGGQFAPVRLESGGGVQRRSKLAIPLTHYKGINGHTPYRLALDVFDNQAQSKNNLKVDQLDEMLPGERGLDYQDVHSFIRSESQAAYAFLNEPATVELWNYCGPKLAHAIREQRRRITSGTKSSLDKKHISVNEEIKNIRHDFFAHIEAAFPESKDSTTATLAWHIIVESALLNEQLVTDMQQVSSTKNCACLSRDWMQFYGPNPPPESRAAFNQYVECRWPIRVFALDPVTQDQNLGVQFSRRRELQLVLALAAATKRVGIQSLTRFVRRLEYDLETIELNQTEVGFSHGEDTFGWRFFPRVQAPPVPGNLRATGELLLGGPSRDRDLLTRKLEPGMRECVAIVVMPSFVPYVTVDTRTNWFLLTDKCLHMKRAGHREMDVRDAVENSREIVELRALATACFKDAPRYRDGEIYRLQRAVDQLDRQLPLQTAYVQMPYENTLGGFEMFNTGVTDLAPELLGWYGGPGLFVGGPSSDSATVSSAVARLREEATKASAVAGLAEASGAADADKLRTKANNLKTAADDAEAQAIKAGLNPSGKTSLFLVGKNFSVLRNTVIAGGARIPREDMEVISRQVMRVTIPWAVNTVDVRGNKVVDIHLATPYGATSHLHVPAIPPVETVVTAKLEEAKQEVVEEATKVAKKMVDAQAPVVQFDWAASAKKAAANIIYTEKEMINEFTELRVNTESDLVLTETKGDVHEEFVPARKVQTAWYVDFRAAADGDWDNKDNKRRIAPISHTIENHKIGMGDYMTNELKTFVSKLDPRDPLHSIRLRGYLRYIEDEETTQPLPIVRIPALIVPVKTEVKKDKDE